MSRMQLNTLHSHRFLSLLLNPKTHYSLIITIIIFLSHPIPQSQISLLAPGLYIVTHSSVLMADRTPGHHQLQVHPQRGTYARHHGQNLSRRWAVVTLLPVGGTLLGLAGLTLVGTLIGLALTTPLFLLASPILVPAALFLGLAVAGFMSSGAFGLTGLSSLSWVLNAFRQKVPDMDYAKQRLQDTVVTLGQKTKDVGEKIQTKAHETGRDTTGTGRDTVAAK